MRAWRLVATSWSHAAFDGEGARLSGGRWNSKGVPVVYLASSLALAALELLVHIDYEVALRDHVAIPVEFREELLLTADLGSLPEDWGSPEGRSHTQALGDAWVRSGASALLAVPSRIVPIELNYLLNPAHPDVEKLAVGSARPFRYDPRLLGRR